MQKNKGLSSLNGEFCHIKKGDIIMTKINSIEVYCPICKTWSKSPYFIDDMETFMAMITGGNITNCPKGHIINSNKENFRVRSDDGGFRGIDTI